MLDGFSFANLGAEQKLTSAEMAINADRLARRGRARTIQDVGETSTDSTIKDEDLTEKEGSGYSLHSDISDGKEDDEENNSENNENDTKFVVKLNTQTQLLELIEVQSQKIIQTISPDEMSKLVLKMRNPSGIMVNKKI